MKKILVFLTLSSLVFANESLNKFEKDNFNFSDKKATLEVEKSQNKLGEFNDINLNSSIIYDSSTSKFINNNNVSYSLLNYNLGLDLGGRTIVTHSIGVSKTLNDYFYNKVKDVKIKNGLAEARIDDEIVKDLEKKVDLVKKYILKKYEVELNKKQEEKHKKEIVVLKELLNKGLISLQEYNTSTSNISLEDYRYTLEANYLESIAVELTENDLSIDKLPQIDEIVDIKELSSNVKLEDIEKYVTKLINLEMLNIENIKLTKDKYFVNKVIPSITPSANYDFINKAYTIGLTVSSNIQIFDAEYSKLKDADKLADKSLAKLDIKKDRLIRELTDTYDRLVYAGMLNQNNVKNLTADLAITEKKYELGNEKYTKVLEKRAELIKAQIALKEAIINLNIFEWKVKRGVK